MGHTITPIEYVDYTIDKIDFIRQALSGYAGGVAIASEMVQNADDAGASRISFHFRDDALIVRNNSPFSEQDFVNITHIATGKKRTEAGKIGTWGTGFLSVFHLTDAPGLFSSGKQVIFDPTKEKLPVHPTNITNATEFRLPWRTQRTALCTELEADIWTPKRIQALKEEMAVAIYRLILFLRHVDRIEVYEGDAEEKLLYHVERRREMKEDLPAFVRERWRVEYRRAGVKPYTDVWLRYRSSVPSEYAAEGVTVKDRAIDIAFPLERRDWLDENVPGALYNFLPTPIRTGFKFQINGAFFPDNNRRGILASLETQRAKSQWNMQVLASLGNLFSRATIDIRDQVGQPRRFYELLPCDVPDEDIVYRVHAAFAEAVPEQPIVFTSLGDWRRIKDIFVGKPASRLPELASSYVPLLPATDVPQSFRKFISDQKAALLEWQDVTGFLKQHLRTGIKLGDAHPMINTRGKLALLYAELPTSPDQITAASLSSLPLCLASDETLQPFSNLWSADKRTRALFENTSLRFVDYDVQEKYSSLVNALCKTLRGTDAVEWLSQQHLPENILVADAPALLGDVDHLTELLLFIAVDLSQISAELLRSLPLVRTADDHLVSGAAPIYLDESENERTVLREWGVSLVHSFVYGEKAKAVAAVYRKAGVQDLTVHHVVETLRKEEIPGGVPENEYIPRLAALYTYFLAHDGELRQEDESILRNLPLCVTQQGHLVSPRGSHDTLHLPPEDNKGYEQAFKLLDRLQLDNLIHSDLARGEYRPFLTRRLALTPLSPEQLIRTVIVPYYNSERLNDQERVELLRYIENHLRNSSESDADRLAQALTSAKLIKSGDGHYHQAGSIFFASPELDAMFPGGYLQPHQEYGIPVATAGEIGEQPYRHSTRYWLFSFLGVKEFPNAHDLVQVVERTVSSGPPDEVKIEQVRRLYQLLLSELNRRYKTTDPELKQLEQVAWLPASNRNGWFSPRDIYRASQKELVGDQGPLLLLREPTTELRELLNIPENPPVDVVIAHLRARALVNEAVSLRVYEFLAQQASPQHFRALMSEPIIWDKGQGRYWRPDQVFLSDYRHRFGHRRGYLKPQEGDAAVFLARVGVVEEPGLADSVALLKEIASDYAQKDEPIDNRDYHLIVAQLDHLGRQELRPELEQCVRTLRSLDILPVKGGHLSRPGRIVIADQPELLRHFDASEIPQVDESGLSQYAVAFVQQLGVPLLSFTVSRQQAHTQHGKADPAMTSRLARIAPLLKRVILTERQGQPDAVVRADQDAVRLVDVRCFICTQLTVQYTFDDGQGWRVNGHRDEVPAFYDQSNNVFYVKRNQRGQEPDLDIALELERVLLPTTKTSVVIEQLLGKTLVDGKTFLDDHGYQKLHDEELSNAVPLSGVELSDLGESPTEDSHPPDSGSESEAITLPLDFVVDESRRAGVDDASDAVHPSNVGDVSASVPAFTGQIRPITPVLPNDYGELKERYGITGLGTTPSQPEIGNADRVPADSIWGMPSVSLNGKASDKVSVVRFTLTFTNRTQGFLPLYTRAMQMLADKPSVVHCQTDFPDWEFDLYADYGRAILYNETELPRLFEAYNIPAGGIIYLERVHENKLRLYWHQANSRVENVRCLELLEDGTLDEFEVPAADFPCEIAEYVLRSEKRLEDIDALFAQAQDKRGVFQTLCAAFGQEGRELDYDDLYKGVMVCRPVAKASIDYQLQQRPCFVNVGDNRWRFEPKRGHLKQQAMRQNGIVISQPSSEPVADAKPPQASSPDLVRLQATETPAGKFALQLIEALNLMNEELQSNEPRDTSYLAQFAQRLIDLGQQLAHEIGSPSSAGAPAGKWSALDDMVQTLEKRPADAAIKRQVLNRLYEETEADHHEGLLGYLRNKLSPTLGGYRNQTLPPILHELAEQVEQARKVDLAYDLLKMMQEQHAGHFEDAIERLDALRDVQTYIALIRQADDDWLALCRDSWQKHPGDAELRLVIAEALSTKQDGLEQCIDQHLDAGEVSAAFETYCQWANEIEPLKEAWRMNTGLEQRIFHLAHRVYQALAQAGLANESIPLLRQALALIASMPVEAQRGSSAESFLDAIIAVASWECDEQKDVLAAAALLQYGMYSLEVRKQITDDDETRAALEQISRWYRDLGYWHLAYTFLSRVHQKAPSADKTRLGQRLYEIGEGRRQVSVAEERDRWQASMKALAQQQGFRELVNPTVVEMMIDTWVAE